MTTTEITWRTDDLSIERCAQVSGWTVEQLRGFLAKPGFANTARCRAHGAWDANDREGHALWWSLHNLAKGQE